MLWSAGEIQVALPTLQLKVLSLVASKEAGCLLPIWLTWLSDLFLCRRVWLCLFYFSVSHCIQESFCTVSIHYHTWCHFNTWWGVGWWYLLLLLWISRDGDAFLLVFSENCHCCLFNVTLHFIFPSRLFSHFCQTSTLLTRQFSIQKI